MPKANTKQTRVTQNDNFIDNFELSLLIVPVFLLST